jgi:hypothetical protein
MDVPKVLWRCQAEATAGSDAALRIVAEIEQAIHELKLDLADRPGVASCTIGPLLSDDPMMYPSWRGEGFCMADDLRCPGRGSAVPTKSVQQIGR